MAYKPLSYKIDRIKVSFVEESPPGHVGQILEGFNSSELIVIWREASVVLAECWWCAQIMQGVCWQTSQ